MEPSPLALLIIIPIVLGVSFIYVSFTKEAQKFEKEKKLVKEEKLENTNKQDP